MLGTKIQVFWKMSVWMYVCVCVRVCVGVCMYVCVCIRLDLNFYSIDFNRKDLILFVFFLCDGGSNPRFLIGPIRFFFISNFRFSQNCFFAFFSMIGSRYFNRKSVKKLIISKKDFSSYHGSPVIKKNVLFFRHDRYSFH